MKIENRGYDVSDELTVFHITVGDPNYQESRKQLKNQTIDFTLETIENVTPMSAAFQEMLDRCETPLYVQVDEDMILERDAVRQMYEDIKETPDDVMFLAYWLNDPHVDRKVSGVKIYKYNIMKNYPFRDCYSTEVDQFQRAEEDGYKWEARMPIMGKHSPQWTAYSAYQRYRGLFQKHQTEGHLDWITQLPDKFFQRLLENPSKEDLWGLLGALSGVMNGEIQQERNHNTYGGKEFQQLKDFVESQWSLGDTVD